MTAYHLTQHSTKEYDQNQVNNIRHENELTMMMINLQMSVGWLQSSAPHDEAVSYSGEQCTHSFNSSRARNIKKKLGQCHSCWCPDCLGHQVISRKILINTLRPRRNEQYFADDIFKCIFFNENVWISIKISLKFIHKGPINNIPALVQIMAWRRPGDKPLSESMMVNLPTHICVTRPQWVEENWNH